MRRFSMVALAVLLVVVGAASAACSDDGDDGSAAPSLSDPTATGGELATEFMTILSEQDERALGDFLAEGFVIQRADGSTATRAEYLAAPIQVSAFELGDEVLGVQDGDVLVVRWAVKATEATDEGAFAEEEAPRLSTFVWRDGTWKMAAHANFNVRPQ